MKYDISYGKHDISVYRSYAAPLRVAPIPESSFTGRQNTVLAAMVSVDVYGANFLPAYTQGDNSMVVATDTMRNFTYAVAFEYTGATHEGLAAFLARRFLDTYPQIERVRVRVDEIPFAERTSRLLTWSAATDHGTVRVEMSREGIADLECGRLGLRVLKTTGSAFRAFHRDMYTTLPEAHDRPLHIFFDIRWRYLNPAAAVTGDGSGLVPSEQVRDLALHTFDGFVSMSIQHLIHEMGVRILDRFRMLSEVGFAAQNRTWDTSGQSERDPKVRVMSEPKPAHGYITLRLRRD